MNTILTASEYQAHFSEGFKREKWGKRTSDVAASPEAVTVRDAIAKYAARTGETAASFLFRVVLEVEDRAAGKASAAVKKTAPAVVKTPAPVPSVPAMPADVMEQFAMFQKFLAMTTAASTPAENSADKARARARERHAAAKS